MVGKGLRRHGIDRSCCKLSFAFFPVFTAALALSSHAFAQPVYDEAKLRVAEARGREIFLKDMVAARATEVVGIPKLEASATAGWITVGSDAEWQVRFVGPCAAGTCSYFDVDFDLRNEKEELHEHAEPVVLPAEHLAQWKAIEQAYDSELMVCKPAINTVVLNADDGSFLVYMLVATTDADLLVLAGHHRLTVSADGEKLEKIEALSDGCLEVERDDSEAIGIVHLSNNEPTEAHVFTSLLYQKQLYVRTEAGIFSVEGPQINFMHAGQ